MDNSISINNNIYGNDNNSSNSCSKKNTVSFLHMHLNKNLKLFTVILTATIKTTKATSTTKNPDILPAPKPVCNYEVKSVVVFL
jgi:hypothetical protein